MMLFICYAAITWALLLAGFVWWLSRIHIAGKHDNASRGF